MNGRDPGGRPLVGAVLAGLCLLAQPTVAGADGIERIERRLEQGEWLAAVERAVKVRDGLLKEIDRTEGHDRIARTVMLQAVAEANLGRDHLALWHWHLAQNFLDGLPGLDLSRYGRAADLLAGRALDDVPEMPPPPAEGEAEGGRRSRDREVDIESTVEPVYPKALRKSGMEGSVQVRIVVGTDGRPRQPVVQDAGLVPTMAFPALEALAGWRFTPAQREGRALPVYYELKIRYR